MIGVLEEAYKNAGFDRQKIQIAAIAFLEIAKDNNLNQSEFRLAMKKASDALDYSLSRLSANAWFATAEEKAKE